MTDRLTDEDLRRFDELCAHRRKQHSTMLSLLVDDVEAMTAELRARRARDLSAEDLEALEWVRHQCKRAEHGHPTRMTKAALTILDRLTKGQP